MPDSGKVSIVVREWMRKADNDLKSASHILKLWQKTLVEVVCFHAQQCVEKYLKALLVLKNVDFPKTHDIEKLMALLPEHVRPQFVPKDEERFTEYAVDTQGGVRSRWRRPARLSPSPGASEKKSEVNCPKKSCASKNGDARLILTGCTG
jgi:HEPN domain-containing protein